MGNEVINVKGVNVNKADYKGIVKEGRTEYVELKNGVKIDIWAPNRKKEVASVYIAENNKVVLKNVFVGSLTGTDGNDNIEMHNCGDLNGINLGAGDDKISVFNSQLASINCGDGNDSIRLENSLIFKDVHAEKIEFHNSNTLGRVYGENTLFTNDSSFVNPQDYLHGKVEVRNCKHYPNSIKYYE